MPREEIERTTILLFILMGMVTVLLVVFTNTAINKAQEEHSISMNNF